MKNLILLSLIFSFFHQCNAIAFDLIRYDETSGTFAYTIRANDDGESINMLTCPKDVVIKSLDQCNHEQKVLPVADFASFVKVAIQKWAISHPGVGASPLTANDVANYASAVEQIESVSKKKWDIYLLQKNLQEIRAVLKKMPDSALYLKRQSETLLKIQKIEATLELDPRIVAVGKHVEEVVEALSESLLPLLRNNNEKTNLPFYFAQSRMKNTLIDLVMNELALPDNRDYPSVFFGGKQYQIKLMGTNARYLAKNGQKLEFISTINEVELSLQATPSHLLVFVVLGGQLRVQFIGSKGFLEYSRLNIGPSMISHLKVIRKDDQIKLIGTMSDGKIFETELADHDWSNPKSIVFKPSLP